ncbi:hypothetical protein ARMGADRAFT_1032839 [Armillaria gallica]|uniref:Uncharacterized protein n=1 Tax=Armillaria gallica TaxID=47427 RepID=A0A2H3DNA2_ARMGA|nr:hypothetical protein ARMGADRAFT_1032839 [Armillaria gallica]
MAARKGLAGLLMSLWEYPCLIPIYLKLIGVWTLRHSMDASADGSGSILQILGYLIDDIRICIGPFAPGFRARILHYEASLHAMFNHLRVTSDHKLDGGYRFPNLKNIRTHPQDQPRHPNECWKKKDRESSDCKSDDGFEFPDLKNIRMPLLS